MENVFSGVTPRSTLSPGYSNTNENPFRLYPNSSFMFWETFFFFSQNKTCNSVCVKLREFIPISIVVCVVRKRNEDHAIEAGTRFLLARPEMSSIQTSFLVLIKTCSSDKSVLFFYVCVCEFVLIFLFVLLICIFIFSSNMSLSVVCLFVYKCL